MAKRTNLKYDGIGYVNNQGKSKYWGVTTGRDSMQRDYWLVSFQPKMSMSTVTFRADWNAPSEQDMARVAALIYENQGDRTAWGRYAILSHDKKWHLIIMPFSNRIIRRRATAGSDRPIYRYANENTLVGAMVTASKAPTPKSVKIKAKGATMTKSEVLDEIDSIRSKVSEVIIALDKLSNAVKKGS